MKPEVSIRPFRSCAIAASTFEPSRGAAVKSATIVAARQPLSIKRAAKCLRLALLYNAAGMKDKAAAEYEAFLKQRPDYPDRKQLEEYISTNKKP